VPLLTAIVGSQAYGLATADSDVDRLGVFAYPTMELVGLDTPSMTWTNPAGTKPDVTYHEAAKFAALALNGNPTITELLWLDSYEIVTPFGAELVALRRSLLSRQRVRNAYLGYATQQLDRLASRTDGTFSSDTRLRTAKHARHLYRLCHQGYGLYAHGFLQVRLDEPEKFRAFGEQVAGGGVEVARAMLAMYERLFDKTVSPLPTVPDREPVLTWLAGVRRFMW
jgi:hypothetical protein